MKIKYLEYIVEMAKCGSINRAAQNCFVSQSHLSNIIKNVEEEIGYAIVRRDSRGISLTDDGNLFVQEAEQILQRYENIITIPEWHEKTQSLDMICSPSSVIFEYFLDFINENPSVQESDTLREGGIRLIFKNIISQYARLGIISLFSQRKENYVAFGESYNLEVSVLLDHIPVTVVMAKDHPLSTLPIIHIEDLHQHALVVDANVDFDDTLSILGIKTMKNVLFISDRGSMMDALRKGHFVSVVIQLPESDLSLHKLVCRPLVGIEDDMSIMLLRSKNIVMGKREQKFVKGLKANLKKKLCAHN